jgi:hypothetical protein
VLIGDFHSQNIGQFHIETGSFATHYSSLFACRAWLHGILQDRLIILNNDAGIYPHGTQQGRHDDDGCTSSGAVNQYAGIILKKSPAMKGSDDIHTIVSQENSRS